MKLTASQLETITEHLTRLIVGQERFLSGLRSIYRKDKSQHIKGQIDYTENCISALKWAIAVAKQRCETNVT